MRRPRACSSAPSIRTGSTTFTFHGSAHDLRAGRHAFTAALGCGVELE